MAASTRERILEAAAAVVRRDGVTSLTLEAVAEQAGVSKGGLLYHFPGKRDLIDGLVEHYFADFTAQVHHGADADDEPGAWLRSYVDANVDADPEAGHMGTAVVTAWAQDADVASAVRAWCEQWQRRATEDATDAALATVVRLAADGLWIADLFDLSPPTGEHRERVRTALRRLSVEATTTDGEDAP